MIRCPADIKNPYLGNRSRSVSAIFTQPGLGREAQNVADASSKFTAQAVNVQ